MSYSFNFNQGLGNTSINGANGGYRPPSGKQIQFYIDQCKRKGVPVGDISKFTAKTMSEEIERLSTLPDMANEKQLQTIRDLQQEILNAGLKLNPLNENQLAQLNKNQASKIIERLIDYLNNNRELLPPTEEQIKTLVSWYLCPDIPWESISVEHIDDLRPGANQAMSYTETITIEYRVDLGDGYWRMMTPNEFAEELKNKLSRKLASKIISQYRAVFYEWRRTRSTEAQRSQIRELEQRLANTYTPRQVEMAVDIEGNIFQVTHENLKSQYTPQGYDFISEEHLLMMSKAEASQYIQLLEYELKLKQYKEMNEEDMGWGEREWLSSYEDQLEVNRTTLNQQDAIAKELEELDNLIYQLEMMMGERHDEIHDCVTESVVMGAKDEKTRKARLKLKEFFTSYIKAKPFTPEFEVQYNTVLNICSNNQTAYEILTGE